MKIEKEVKVYETYGGALQITIPKSISQSYGIKGSEKVLVSFSGKKISIEKIEHKTENNY